MYAGMLVLHEGMHVLCSNADNHVARDKRMLVPDNGVFILSKYGVLAINMDCLDHCK